MRNIFLTFGLLIGLISIGVQSLLLCSWIRLSSVENQTPLQAAPSIGRWIDAGDTRIYIQEFGDVNAPPLLLSHGTGAWSGTWVSNIDSMMQAGYRVIAIDLPPFGYSEMPVTKDYSRSAQAKRILALIDTMKLGKVTVLGHSYGGGPAFEATMLAPQSIQHLILLDAAIGLQAMPAHNEHAGIASAVLDWRLMRTALLATVGTQPYFSTYWLKQFVARKEVVTESRTAIYTRPFSVKGYTAGLGDWAYEFAQEDGHFLSQQAINYRKLNLPVTLMWGDEDTITPLSQAHALKALILNSKLLVLPKVGHIPQIENVALFNATLAKLLVESRPSWSNQ
jgi:pimeloyl-ACP methyl ester carboxylesterase